MNIRKGEKADIPAAFRLVQELAEFEKAPEEVNTTVETMMEDGFGPNPIFDFLVAEEGGIIVGMSLFYNRYSTWKGKRLFLEDLIVTQSKRGSGIGKALFEATLAIAAETNCTGMMWQVLDWNQPAIDFYKKYKTRFDEEWINCSIEI